MIASFPLCHNVLIYNTIEMKELLSLFTAMRVSEMTMVSHGRTA
jgi:hypothetical protein